MSFFIVAVALERNVLAITILELLKGAKYPHSNSDFMNIVSEQGRSNTEFLELSQTLSQVSRECSKFKL